MQIDEVPERILLQWHITDSCNFRCKHCYQDQYSMDPANRIERLRFVLNQFLELLDFWEKNYAKRVRAHINVTGGEPFTHPDFFSLLDEFYKYKKRFSFGILSNGSLIDETTAGRLKKYNPGFVQVSLEGGSEVNDSIRGPGSTEKIGKGVQALKKQGIRTLVSFTAHTGNIHEFKEVVKIAGKWRVDEVWSDRFLPFGNGESSSHRSLNKEETKRFFQLMYQNKSKWSFFRKKTDVSMGRALQFLCGGESVYECQAGQSLITVMPDGIVYPCRRLPIPCGNLFERSLTDIYYNNPFRDELKIREVDECKSCEHFSRCKGGLRCLSYAMTGDSFSKDPGCWK